MYFQLPCKALCLESSLPGLALCTYIFCQFVYVVCRMDRIANSPLHTWQRSNSTTNTHRAFCMWLKSLIVLSWVLAGSAKSTRMKWKQLFLRFKSFTLTAKLKQKSFCCGYSVDTVFGLCRKAHS